MSEQTQRRAYLPAFTLCFCAAALFLLLGQSYVAALLQPDMLLVTHGGSANAPAVCLYQASAGFGRGRYSVLCPGSYGSAYELLAQLEQMGCQEIDCIFVPALAAPMRALELYLKRKPPRACVLLGKASSEKNLQELNARLLFAGVNLRHLGKTQRKQWSEKCHPWRMQARRLQNADQQWNFEQLQKNCKIVLTEQKNGLFSLKYTSVNGCRLEKQFPRSNYAQVWKCALRKK
ncbi:MAG: hypothetical protein PHG44_00985 [Lentisphaeria bacterium]|nr:hypothetical protein [Lentisphaeria bacterium]NLZ60669.1 hypothetical protein [Lentisphaerota bacterium]